MIVPLLAGCAKTVVVSMLLEGEVEGIADAAGAKKKGWEAALQLDDNT